MSAPFPPARDPVYSSVLRRLETWPPSAIVALAAVLVGVIGLADVATGEEISSSVFYALPVAVAAWYSGGTWGYAFCLFAAATWYEADLVAGATYAAAWIPIWNAGVRLVFFVIIAGLLGRLRDALETQRNLAEVDPLTGLPNTRRFLAAVESEIPRTARYRRALSLAYIDLDGFKGVNDRWGHEAGDAVLREVGRVLRATLRRTDVPSRLGGDEFAVLFPETPADAAHEATEKLRSALEASMRERGWPVGFSVGVITSDANPASAEDVIREADALMYQVKQSGKGRAAYRTLQAPRGEGSP